MDSDRGHDALNEKSSLGSAICILVPSWLGGVAWLKVHHGERESLRVQRLMPFGVCFLCFGRVVQDKSPQLPASATMDLLDRQGH